MRTKSKRYFRLNYLIDKPYQFKQIFWTALIVTVSCTTLAYLVYFSTWTFVVSKSLEDMSKINLYPGAKPDLISEAFLVKTSVLILLISVAFASLWSLFFTHKVAGPAWKFKNALHQVADGNYTEALNLRKGDYLTDVAASFNTTLKALEDKDREELKRIQEMQDKVNKLITLSKDPSVDIGELRELAKQLENHIEQWPAVKKVIS